MFKQFGSVAVNVLLAPVFFCPFSCLDWSVFGSLRALVLPNQLLYPLQTQARRLVDAAARGEHHAYIMEIDANQYIDARFKANLARFINHRLACRA